MAIKISGSTIIDDGRQLVNVGVSTISALNVSGNINANGNIIGDNSTNISGISSVTATSYFGNGENLTGVGFKPDADENLFAGTDAGSNLDGTSGCFNIFLGSVFFFVKYPFTCFVSFEFFILKYPILIAEYPRFSFSIISITLPFSILITVTGTDWPDCINSLVIPNLVPINPIVIIIF